MGVNEDDTILVVVGIVIEGLRVDEMLDTGVTNDTSPDVTVVGLRKEVSKLASKPSGIAILRVEGDALSTDESYD